MKFRGKIELTLDEYEQTRDMINNYLNMIDEFKEILKSEYVTKSEVESIVKRYDIEE